MAIAGKGGKVVLAAATVADVTSWKLDIAGDTLENTKLGDDWKSFIQGLKEWSGSLECNWNVAGDAAGQKALQDALLGGTVVTLKLYVNATNFYTGTALISKEGITDGVADLVGLTFDVQGSGALSYT